MKTLIAFIHHRLPSLVVILMCSTAGLLTRLVGAEIISQNQTIAENDLTYDGADLIVSNATVTINGRHAFNSLLLTNKAVVTHAPCTLTETHKLDLVVTNKLMVDATSQIDVSRQGYRPGYTSGNTVVGGAGFRVGGSYGGIGSSAPVTAAYGDFAEVNDWGGGGSSQPGGGLVQIKAGTMQLDGAIAADGGSENNGNGGGAGGGR